MKNKILILNGSIRGILGNSYQIALAAKKHLEKKENIEIEIYNLSTPKQTVQEVYNLLDKSNAFIVISGTYWNNLSSTLQRFIEVCTPFENTEVFFGKPISTIISMDSVGGVDVANKIISAFSGLGCWTPPCSTIVLSRLGQEAVNRTKEFDIDPNEDVWRIEDLEILIDNLVLASQLDKKKWKAWPNIQLKITDQNWPEAGNLNMGNEIFI
jgi:NAD(P)H-dependent FMN reductase